VVDLNLVTGHYQNKTSAPFCSAISRSATAWVFNLSSNWRICPANAPFVAGFGARWRPAGVWAAIGKKKTRRLGTGGSNYQGFWSIIAGAAPGLVFCLFNAQNIVAVLYPKAFAPVVGTLLGPYFYPFLNLIVRTWYKSILITDAVCHE